MKQTIKQYLEAYPSDYIFIYKDKKISVEGFKINKNKWIFKSLNGTILGLFRTLNLINRIVLDEPEESILLVN